jgi:glycosyltransferase involved in cell wall biosynthesis
MKIALVVPGGVDRSGRERVIPALLWLIERLARRHQVRVMALHQEPEPCQYSLLGAQVVNLGQVPGGLPGARFLRRLRRLVDALREGGGAFDVLHGFWADEVGPLAVAAGRWLGLPVVVSVSGGELAWIPAIGYGSQGCWSRRARVALALRLAGAVTAGSQTTHKLLAARRLPAHLVPLGVDVALFAAPVARPQGPLWRLLHVASINRVKDPATLLGALQIVVQQQPGVHLDWVGQDTLGGSVQALAASLGLRRHVCFHGFQPTGQVASLCRQAHLYVQSSLHEAQGVAVCEAAAAGVPAVGTAVGLVADLAPDAALAVPVRDPEALAGRILALLADARRRERLGQAAQAWAQAHDAGWTAGQFEVLYEQMCC